MCLAVPGRIVSRTGRVGMVEFGGLRREVALDLVPEAAPGTAVLVHAGFAIQTVDLEDEPELAERLGVPCDPPTS